MDAQSTGFTPSRRTLVKGAAWSVPVVAVASQTPAMAMSLRIDPGINGWVLNSPNNLWGCTWSLRVNSNPGNPPQTPDGAPFGLYLYDFPADMPIDEVNERVRGARITYWIIGTQNATWSANFGHSSCWGSPVRGTPQDKADGLVYTPYTWTYTHAPANCQLTRRADGRIWFPEFDVTADFTQPSDRCSNVTYWTQRSVEIYNGDAWQLFTFERRNGTLGPYSGTGRNAMPESVDVDALDAQIAELEGRIARLDAEIAAAGNVAPVEPSGGVDDAAVTAAPEAAVTEAPAPVDASALEAEKARLVELKAGLEAQREGAEAEVAVDTTPRLT